MSHNTLNQYGNETIPRSGMEDGDLFTDGTNWWCRVTNYHEHGGKSSGWRRIDPDQPYVHPDGTWWVRDPRTNIWNQRQSDPSPEWYGDW